jgi:hypothetical protein
MKKGVTDREVQLVQIDLPNTGESICTQQVLARSTNKHDSVSHIVTFMHARHEFIAWNYDIKKTALRDPYCTATVRTSLCTDFSDTFLHVLQHGSGHSGHSNFFYCDFTIFKIFSHSNSWL